MKSLRIPIHRLLHPKQLECYNNLARFNVIICGRRFGKTRLAAFKLFTSALQIEGVYFWVSPTREVGNSAWRLVKRLVLSTFGEGIAIINETMRSITLPNGSIIEFKSADNPDGLRSEGLRGVVLDETAQIKQEAWTESLRPALSDYKGWAIFIGTPKGRNWLYKLYKSAEKDGIQWKAFTYTTYDNPFVDPKEIDDAKRDLSEKSFRQEYLAEFVSDNGTIFKREWFENRQESPEIIARWFSWDTAASINDTAAFTAGIVGELTADYRLYIREVFRDRLEFPQLEQAITALARNYQKDGLTRGIIIENKSSGISALQSLRQTCEPEISDLLIGFNPKGSKLDRANGAAKWAEKDSIILPPYGANTQWLFNFEDELLSYPDVPYLDQTDALAQLCDYVSNYLQEGLIARSG